MIQHVNGLSDVSIRLGTVSMAHSALHRARRFGASPGTLSILVLGTSSALLIPALVLNLAVIFQLLVSQEAPTDLLLGPLVSGGWPFYGNEDLFLLVLVSLGVLLSVLQATSLVLLHRVIQRAALQVVSKLRAAIHQQTFRLGPHELLDVTRSRPEELFSDHSELVRRGLVDWWQAMPRSIVAFACLLVISVAVNFGLTMLAVLVTIYSLRIYAGMKNQSAQRTQHWRDSAAASLTHLLQRLTLARLRVGYELEEPSTESFEKQLQPYEAAELRANTSEALMGPLLTLIALVASAFLLLIVGLSHDFTVAGTMVLGVALCCAFFPARRLLRLMSAIESAEAAAAEIFAFLDRQPSVHQSPKAIRLERLQTELKFDRVTLTGRDGHILLDETSFGVPAGTCVALLASDRQTPIAMGGLFPRFYDPQAGRILFDNCDIRQATLDTLRGQALLVPAEGLVFAGSVIENVMCGNNGFTALQVTDALKIARAFDFVQRLPDQLSTQLDAFDSRLSPAQAFRLGLARALVREPSLLVIQEPEVETEADSQPHDEVMHDLRHGRTVVAVPSRLATLRTADSIFLFHAGKLHDRGTHAELLQRSELYRHIIYVRYNLFRDQVEA